MSQPSLRLYCELLWDCLAFYVARCTAVVEPSWSLPLYEGCNRLLPLSPRLSSLRPQLPRIVPPGPSMAQVASQDSVVSNSARRLEVLCNCINHVFDNKISDARKVGLWAWVSCGMFHILNRRKFYTKIALNLLTSKCKLSKFILTFCANPCE